MPPAHFLNAPTYRRRHHGGSGAHRCRDRGDHQEFLISLLILCKTEDVSTSSVLFYCQTLSLRASPQTGVAIRIPSLSPSVGVGVPDDPHAQPPCHAIGAGSYPARSAAPSLIPCRAAPMCAAARPRIAPLALRRGGLPCPPAALSNPVIANQRARWCGNPYPPRISCIFLRRAGCPHPVADKHSTPQTLSLRGA